MAKTDIKSMNEAELISYLAELSQPKFRATQLFGWLQSGAEDFDDMTNIPKPLRGVGIAFIITGLMGMAFMSFLGIKL